MRRFRAIIQSKTEPEDKYVLWVTHDSLSYYNNGEWVPLLSSPEIGEAIEQIKDEVDKSLDIKLEDLERSLIRLIEEEVNFRSSLANTFIILKDKAVLTDSEYSAINSSSPSRPVYIQGGDGNLYKMYSGRWVPGMPSRSYSAFGIRVSNVGVDTLDIDTISSSFQFIADTVTKKYTVKELSSQIHFEEWKIFKDSEALNKYIIAAGYTDATDFIDSNSPSYFIDLDNTDTSNQDTVITAVRRDMQNNRPVSVLLKYKNKQYWSDSIDIMSSLTSINCSTANYSNSNVRVSGYTFQFKNEEGPWKLNLAKHNAVELKTMGTVGTSNEFLSSDGSYHSPKLKTINSQSLLGEGDISFNMDLYLVVSSLPAEGNPNKIYLLPEEGGTEGNLYTEYAYVDGKWEEIGRYKASVDLTSYMKKTDFNAVNVPSNMSVVRHSHEVLINYSTLEAGDDGILVETPQEPLVIPNADVDHAGVLHSVDKQWINQVRQGFVRQIDNVAYYDPNKVTIRAHKVLDNGGLPRLITDNLDINEATLKTAGVLSGIDKQWITKAQSKNWFNMVGYLGRDSDKITIPLYYLTKNASDSTPIEKYEVRELLSATSEYAGVLSAQDKRKLDNTNVFYITEDIEVDEDTGDGWKVLRGAADVFEYLGTHDKANVFIYVSTPNTQVFGSGIAIKNDGDSFWISLINYDSNSLLHVIKVTFNRDYLTKAISYTINEDHQIENIVQNISIAGKSLVTPDWSVGDVFPVIDIPLATPTVNGVMPTADKKLLDSISNNVLNVVRNVQTNADGSTKDQYALTVFKSSIINGVFTNSNENIFIPQANENRAGALGAADKEMLNNIRTYIASDGLVSSIVPDNDETSEDYLNKYNLAVYGYTFGEDGRLTTAKTNTITINPATSGQAGIMPAIDKALVSSFRSFYTDKKMVTDIGLSETAYGDKVGISISKAGIVGGTNIVPSDTTIEIPAASSQAAGVLSATDKSFIDSFKGSLKNGYIYSIIYNPDATTAYEVKMATHRNILLGDRFMDISENFSIPSASTTKAGVITASDKSKLNTIKHYATADEALTEAELEAILV